jgi:uncharacterized repeat protein (TIGR03803 family)
VFKLGAGGNETVLHKFTGADGADPHAGLLSVNGEFWGTAAHGGTYGNGTVFEMSSSGQITVLYSFGAVASDGALPYAGLVGDAFGNLYGTTSTGGSSGCVTGCGTVFEIDTSNKETILYSFSASRTGGVAPYGGLALDSQGNVYGTTTSGGDLSCAPSFGCGTVFKIGIQPWHSVQTDALTSESGL